MEKTNTQRDEVPEGLEQAVSKDELRAKGYQETGLFFGSFGHPIYERHGSEYVFSRLKDGRLKYLSPYVQQPQRRTE